MSRKISHSIINGRTGAGTGGQGLKVEWDSTNDGQLHWMDVDESSLIPIDYWYGDRAVGASGNGSYNDIQYLSISSAGNGVDFGDLTIAGHGVNALSDGARGIFASLGTSGCESYSTINYITISTTGNATDFGDRNVNAHLGGCTSDGTRGVFAAGGMCGSNGNTDAMEYITIATTGNGTDFGDVTVSRANCAGANDSTRGLTLGGITYGPSFHNIIDYHTIQTTGNAIDFGNLTQARSYGGACSNGTRALMMGGQYGNGCYYSNVIDYVTIQTTGNSTDFGDLASSNCGGRGYCAATSDGTADRGMVFGGSGSQTSSEYVTISTTGNATSGGTLINQSYNTGYTSGD